MTIVRLDPNAEGRPSVARAFDHFFDGFPWNGYAANAVWEPHTDMYETADELVVRVELPGMKKDDIDLRIEAGVLMIGGHREADTEAPADSYHRLERRYGRFTRAFRLPTIVEETKVAATYEDGVLTVRLPKAAAVKPRRIEIAA